jgi:hypothetical protein
VCDPTLALRLCDAVMVQRYKLAPWSSTVRPEDFSWPSRSCRSAPLRNANEVRHFEILYIAYTG